jgi:hypothetical protein
MNRRAFCLLAGVVVLSGIGRLQAETIPMNIVAERKLMDADRGESRSTKVVQQKWAYKVTVENKSFKDLENLEVEYRIYVEDDTLHNLADKGKLKALPGEKEVAKLENAQKFTFETRAVAVNKSELKAGWHYRGGAKEKVEDELGGIWIRVYQDGEVVNEFANPPVLKERKWEEGDRPKKKWKKKGK